jgi:HEAT repeat protein
MASAVEKSQSDPDLARFIKEVKDFVNGRWTPVAADTLDLLNKVRDTLNIWTEDGQMGRDTYAQSVLTEYSRFVNPAIGQEMDYSATVQLKLRAQVAPTRERPEWQGQESQEEQRGGLRRGRDRDREAERRARERLRQETQTVPKLAEALLAERQRLVVLGDVGAGKSTLLKRLAHDTALAYQRGHDSRLPILVTATRLGQMARRYPDETLAEVVGRLQEDDTRIESLKLTIRSTISNVLTRGQTLLLIDGLDEASATEQAAAVALLGQLGANRALLASRPSAYHSQLAGWPVADLQPLGAEQRHDLIVEVFRLERQQDEQPPSDDTLNADARELEKALRNRQSDLAAWGGNPLLLTLIAVQYARDHRLPASRAHIYEFAIEDLQGQRPANARRYLTNNQLQRFVQILALRMQEALRRTATVAEVCDTYLPTELAAEFPEEPLRAAAAVELLRRSGVLQADSVVGDQAAENAPQTPTPANESYTFVHISFREYLAASAITHRSVRAQRELLRRHSLSGQWEQVYLLLVSQLDSNGRADETDELIRILLRADQRRVPALGGKDPTHIALQLASQCVLSRGRPLSGRLWNALSQAWWRVWRGEIQRYREIEEGMRLILRFFEEYGESGDDALPTPNLLNSSLPFIIHRLHLRRYPVISRAWAPAILFALGTIALLALLGQITLHVSLLANSGWGIWLSAALPALILGSLLLLAGIRVAGMSLHSRANRHGFLIATMSQRDEAVHALSQLGSEGVKALLPLLGDSDHYVREAAAQALGQLGDARAVEPLLASLGDSDTGVRLAVEQALGQLGDARAVEPLLALLGGRDVYVSEKAAQALGQLGDARAVEPLLASLGERSRDVRWVAAQALGQLGVAAVEPLLASLGERSRDVRWVAAQALGRLGDARAVEPLLASLGDSDHSVHETVAQALGQLGDARAVGPFLASLGDSNAGIRQAAAQALGRLSDARAVEPLLSLLGDDYSVVRQAAAQTLGQLGDARAVEPLLSLLGDSDHYVRRAVAQALAQLGDARAVESLLPLLGDSELDVRQAAAQALGQLGDARAVEPLLASLGDSKRDVRQATAQALAQLGVAVEPLLPLLRDTGWRTWRTREAAAQTLGQLGDARAVEPLLASLGDSDTGVRLAVEQALELLGDVRTVEPIFKRVRRQSGWWALGPLAFVHQITDWPLILGVIVVQIGFLAPVLIRFVPDPLHWLFGISAWWQILLLIAIFVVGYAGPIIVSAAILLIVQEDRETLLDTAETIVRRTTADADIKPGTKTQPTE